MQALEYDDGPLVWVCPLYTPYPTMSFQQRPRAQKEWPNIQIDCEMTGLNAFEDKIIEIAVIITNGHLEPVDEGIEFIIRTDKSILDKWVHIPIGPKTAGRPKLHDGLSAYACWRVVWTNGV